MLSARFMSIFLEATTPPLSDQTQHVEDTVQNTVNEVNSVFNTIKEFILERGLSIVTMLLFAILIYVVGKKIKKILTNIIKRALERSSMEASVTHFLVKMCDVLFNLILIIIVVDFLGIDTTSLVAVVGSAGLAAGLALQGSLANFAGGVLILIMKPFKLGDYIITSGVEGTVTGIDIFYTRLTTIDNRSVVIPNGSLSSTNIENVTALPYRRIDLLVPVEYSANLKEIKEILMKIAMDNENVLKDTQEHMPMVFVNEFEASDISMGFRCWVVTENYWTTKWDLQETVKEEFDKNNISIPFNQLDVNIKTENTSL